MQPLDEALVGSGDDEGAEAGLVPDQFIPLQSIDRITDDGAANPVVLRENLFGRQLVTRIQPTFQDQMSNAPGKLFVEASSGELFNYHLMNKQRIAKSLYMMIHHHTLDRR